MQYTRELTTPKFIDRNTFDVTEEVTFVPKRLETSLDYTLRVAARMLYKHYSFTHSSHRRSTCYINYNSNKDSSNILYNNIALTATPDELSVEEWMKELKDYASRNHLVDVHLNVRPRKDLNKITKVHKNGFKFIEQRSIFDACIINSHILNQVLEEYMDKFIPFIPSYEDVLNSVKYWLKLKYRCVDSDIDLSPITEYIYKEGGYTKYYKFIIRNSNTVYNVARLFYGNDKAWLQFKCRTDRSIKEEVDVPEEEIYKYYNFDTKKVELPVKYKNKDEYIGIYEYGANRSDRWISVTSKNGKYCLWMPYKVRVAMGSYYHKNGSDKTKNLLATGYYTKNFNILENWNTIKKYLSKVKESINNDEFIVLEYGAYIDRVMGDELTNMPIKKELHEITKEIQQECPVIDVQSTNTPNTITTISEPNNGYNEQVLANEVTLKLEELKEYEEGSKEWWDALSK